MKKINLTFIIILLASFVFAQNDYYWSAGKKHYLKPHDNVFVVKMQKELTLENAQKIKGEQNLKEITKMKRNLGIVVGNDSLLNSKKLKEYKEFLNAMPVYQLGDLPFFLTGEILVHPKANISIDDIIKVVNNKVAVKTGQNITPMFWKRKIGKRYLNIQTSFMKVDWWSIVIQILSLQGKNYRLTTQSTANNII